ncbi:MAG: phosphoribosylamine--glycine ligase [Erythrobacter sp.]
MNILLLGSGGREHALAWKLAQSPSLSKLFVSPGNPGMAEIAQLVTLDAANHTAVITFCAQNAVDLVVIGPEAPLVDGLADSLRAAGLAVFGPSKAAAQLEGSKGFTKDLCERAKIPTAGYVRTATLDAAIAALDRFEAPYVLKADGLAAGKGVVIAQSKQEAEAALSDMFGGRFGAAGAEVVIEEFMRGEEASFFALTDGKNVVPFGTAQDHKRVGEGDTGPNTGGMGAYSPAPVLTPELQRIVMESIIVPTVNTMAAEGMPYSGVLYAGLMLTATGPKLIEYNCRFGDPECQVLMTRLVSDLAMILMACARGELASTQVAFVGDAAMTVVMAANGYPGTPEKGGAINLGAAEAHGAKVFHAGTAMADGALVASGGRVLNVTASGPSVTAARDAAYKAVDEIDFPSGFCRRDIGHREIAREAEKGAK